MFLMLAAAVAATLAAPAAAQAGTTADNPIVIVVEGRQPNAGAPIYVKITYANGQDKIVTLTQAAPPHAERPSFAPYDAAADLALRYLAGAGELPR